MSVVPMKKGRTDLHVDALTLDGRLQPRQQISTEVVNEYTEALADGARFPPVSVMHDGETYWVYDGFHRVQSYRQAGLSSVPVNIESGQWRDALLRSLAANSTHGLRRTNQDKRLAVTRALDDPEWWRLSDREVARICGVDHKFVGKMRHVANGDDPHSETAASHDETATHDSEPHLDYEPPADSGPPTSDDQEWSPPTQPKREAPKQSEFITLDQWKSMDETARGEILRFPESTKGFNKQDSDSIEWAQWSWNPITGCKHDCPYCYARDIAQRFYPQGFEPAILPDRFKAPQNTAVPDRAKDDIAFKNVFTCSMADLFGRWVPAQWIEAVLQAVADNPQWNFLFLTKFPKRMSEFAIPRNAWMGTSVDCQARVVNAERAFEKVDCEVRWLSVEPLIEPLKFNNLSLFQWVVIGGASASSKTPAWIPPIDTVAGLHQQARAAGCKIYYKTNCGMSDELRIKEFPWQQRRRKTAPSVFHYLGKAKTLDQKAETI